jgi:hypothetical protein
MAKSRAKKASAIQKRGQVNKNRNAAGKKAAITKMLTAAKRSAAGKRAAITKNLTQAKSTAAAKWAWVSRQLKRA